MYELHGDGSPGRHWSAFDIGSHGAEVLPQGHDNILGINDRTAGTTQMALNLLRMKRKVKAGAHVHPEHESIIFVLRGFAVTFMGPDQEPTFQRPGSCVFIGKGVDHCPANLGDEDVWAIVARADKGFTENLVLLPYMDEKVVARLPELQADHAARRPPANYPHLYTGSFDLDGVLREVLGVQST